MEREQLTSSTEGLVTKKCWLHQSYQFGVLGCHAVSILNESLELVVLCEGDDLQHSPKLGENLEGIQFDQVRPVSFPNNRNNLIRGVILVILK